MIKVNWKFIWKYVLIGAITLIFEVAVIIISQQNNVWFIVFSSIVMLFVALGVVQLSWITLEKAGSFIYRWRISPRLKRWLELRNENDLRLYIHNPKRSKEIYVECSFKKFTSINGKDYINEHRRDLKLVFPSPIGTTNLIFKGTLSSNDKREGNVGIPHDEKIALYFGNALICGFVDGIFEYTISCTGKYMDKPFELPDSSVWLTIKNGVLVQIKDKL